MLQYFVAGRTHWSLMIWCILWSRALILEGVHLFSIYVSDVWAWRWVFICLRDCASMVIQERWFIKIMSINHFLCPRSLFFLLRNFSTYIFDLFEISYHSLLKVDVLSLDYSHIKCFFVLCDHGYIDIVKFTGSAYLSFVLTAILTLWSSTVLAYLNFELVIDDFFMTDFGYKFFFPSKL